MKTISFKTSKEDLRLIGHCVDRYTDLIISANLPEPDRVSVIMDLSACHANGCPLDFARLYDFPDFDFIHDVTGIASHINRDSGELGDFFVPRCAKP